MGKTKGFLMKWDQVAFILLFTSQYTVLKNYLCALDTTLRVLNTTTTKKLSFLGTGNALPTSLPPKLNCTHRDIMNASFCLALKLKKKQIHTAVT